MSQVYLFWMRSRKKTLADQTEETEILLGGNNRIIGRNITTERISGELENTSNQLIRNIKTTAVSAEYTMFLCACSVPLSV